MPYVDLLSKEDFTSIWYMTNTPSGNVGAFDPDKPTIVMLPPIHLDSGWRYPQLDDPRLSQKYNIIAFDLRVTGKSIYRFNGKYDLWVAAADLAHSFHYLGLPPAHIFASEILSYTACRFASLFPDLCLSLTLCNIPAQSEMKAVFDAYDELCQLWGYAEDLETFEHANKLLLSYCASPTSHVDIQDEIVGYWQMEYPPWRRSHIISFAQVCLNRTEMTAAELAGITAPTLIIQADKNPLYPPQNAENLQNALVNVPGGAMIYMVKAEIGFITLFSASIVNQTFAKFLARQPRARSDIPLRVHSCEQIMKPALEKLASYKMDSSILSRDPTCALSFSCLPADVCQAQSDAVAVFAKNQRKAWSPLGLDGRPLRKFSERQSHWLADDGYTYTQAEQVKQKKEEKKRSKSSKTSKQEPPPPMPSPPRPAPPPLPTVELLETEPVSQQEQQVARARRLLIETTLGASEQQVVKGTMAKVVAHRGTTTPLRILR
ncbi:alpha/beta-hydrolase [Cristinia sonorae]|uniref:Alpha/beta-hydrolase n=1 Tax=Cristinia sonorae TaxID=1940300 RepID=A0A8K0UXV2_9AGAR|nr:alpha/beta-hydrolase [Cristinia sonorae]